LKSEFLPHPAQPNSHPIWLLYFPTAQGSGANMASHTTKNLCRLYQEALGQK